MWAPIIITEETAIHVNPLSLPSTSLHIRTLPTIKTTLCNAQHSPAKTAKFPLFDWSQPNTPQNPLSFSGFLTIEKFHATFLLTFPQCLCSPSISLAISAIDPPHASLQPGDHLHLLIPSLDVSEGFRRFSSLILSALYVICF